MPSVRDQDYFEKREKLLSEELGRELTPKEKFYVALADACAPRRGKPLILCIEDNEAQLHLRKQILENDGFLVLNAINAAEALEMLCETLEMLCETPVSLVLSDHMLSGESGTQLAGEIKKVKPDVPVVFYSGRTPESLQNVAVSSRRTNPFQHFSP